MGDICAICGHTYGTHYTTNDTEWRGCSECNECQGFVEPDTMSIEERVTCIICGKAFCDEH